MGTGAHFTRAIRAQTAQVIRYRPILAPPVLPIAVMSFTTAPNRSKHSDVEPSVITLAEPKMAATPVRIVTRTVRLLEGGDFVVGELDLE